MIDKVLADGVLTLSLNRPEKMNAMTSQMYLELAASILEAQKDDAVRAVLLRGEGPNFCAGNDLKDFLQIAQQGGADPDPNKFPAVALLRAMVDNELPIVAAVAGAAIGIGTTLLLHCDLVLCAENARLQTPFVDLGLVPEAASSHLLPARIGSVNAAEMLLLGAPIDAHRALQFGLCNRVVAVESLDAVAFEMARALASKPVAALRQSRRLMRADAASLHGKIDRELEVFVEALQGPEARAAISRFFTRPTQV